MKRYANGEVITTDRIELEKWYSDYQTLMEIAARECYKDCDDLYLAFLIDYKKTFGQEYYDTEQILRWSVLHTERSNSPLNY